MTTLQKIFNRFGILFDFKHGLDLIGTKNSIDRNITRGDCLCFRKGGDRLMSFHISKCNRILKTRDTDCVSIAETYHLGIY